MLVFQSNVFQGNVFQVGPAPPTGEEEAFSIGGNKGETARFDYDRPHLFEFAQALRRAHRKHDVEQTQQIAKKVVQIAREELSPLVLPQIDELIDTASRLQQLRQMDSRIQGDQIKTLLLLARHIEEERSRLDEEDVELALLS